MMILKQPMDCVLNVVFSDHPVGEDLVAQIAQLSLQNQEMS